MPDQKNMPQLGDVGSKAIAKAVTLPEYTVATVPSAADNKYRWIWVTDGNAGAPCAAVSNGTSWLRVVPGAAVAAS